ncbi:HAMP domain-containing sensor histidine kinase [Alteromonas sp. 009811495]|uniref:HAMP domain-containing sensor histidine kinase n=1 Tax=Alteromonas sp. 009811495 TaxID=3002962 RepID=UPI00237E919F|nr:HAMP domain-containing sensor histidine kinase [Alteromonas sp. 009811495]WDT86909.1 HAMP domain-containing sensor histidine kinase [Alteromonas sp. 009811495]
MNFSHLNLYARFFLIFTFTTISLAILIILGSFAISEDEAVEIIREREASLHLMMTNLVSGPLDIEKLTEEAKKNRVEIQIKQNGAYWRTGSVLPPPEELRQGAIRIGRLYFKKQNSNYFLSADLQDYSITVTSKIANLIVFPGWIIYWPWVGVIFVFGFSYWLLGSQLAPINRAITSASEISEGNFKYRIDNHPNNDLGTLTRGLNTMAEKIEQLFAAKTELLLSVSHELRSPMARMKVLLALLDNGEVETKLNREINQMDEIVEQLLESERLKDAGNLLNIDTYYLPNVMSEILRQFNEEPKVRVDGHVPEIALQIDLGRFKFLIKNLIENALNHSGVDSPVLISCSEKNDLLAIGIRDFGKGIDEREIERIFEPFSQAGNIVNRSNSGVGLGLYLCRQITLAHNGAIEVQSALGKGSTFTVRLPVKVN